MTVGEWWKSDWFLATSISIFFLLIQTTMPAALQAPDRVVYNLHNRISALPVDHRIALIYTTPGAEPADIQQDTAALISQLTTAGSNQIGLDMIFSPAAGHTRDTTASPLIKAVRTSGNTRLANKVSFDSTGKKLDKSIRKTIRNASIIHGNLTSPMLASGIINSDPGLVQAASGIGFQHISIASGKMIQTQPIIIKYGEQYIPSLPLTLAAGVLHVAMHDVRVNIHTVELGAVNIPLSRNQQILPTGHSDHYPAYQLSDVLSGKTPAALFQHKIILIGSREPVYEAFGTELSMLEIHAGMLQNILNQEFITQPGWAATAEWLLLLTIALYLILALPRLSKAQALITSALLLSTILAGGIYLLSQQSIWLQTFAAALLLLIGHAAILIKQHFDLGANNKPAHNNALIETNKMMAASFIQQGMLDKATEAYLACPLKKDVVVSMLKLAEECERKQQFDTAIRIYKHLASTAPDNVALKQRIQTATHAKQTNTGNRRGMASLVLGEQEKPTLGRYEIQSELGKGAMGTVFLALDPKINRHVAIKAMDLSDEFAADELEAVKASFFHEAEIAGMLNHPNIVTIFDAGEESGLAYIAMEYLDGINMTHYTQVGNLLPLASTLKVGACIADALQYAHQSGVVHRDIKPANIMMMKNKTVKVTDFGIARISEASKSRDGTVLGTPAYMSPEQLAGKHLDGRSDLFSLGVMLYELLTGERPFKAKSITGLMEKITREPHADIRTHRPDIPENIANLIDRLLAKKAAFRMDSATSASAEIKKCLQTLNRNGGEM